MTTFLYTTTSNTVTVTKPREVKQLIQNYVVTVPPEVDPEEKTISFLSTDAAAAFDVYESEDDTEPVTRGFLEELAEYLADQLVIKCLEVRGEGEPAAWKWTVEPRGEVTHTEL